MNKVMLVDDDRTMVKLLRTLLELDGFNVVHVAQGAGVLPMARSEAPDVILMDVHLADADGLELLKELRASSDLSHVPVIMSSGMDVEEECRRAGSTAFILKPYPPDELVQTLKQILGQ